MGRIHPDHSTVQQLKGAERTFAEILIEYLSDEWLIISQLDMIAPNRPYEIDFLLVNPQYGLISIEVKGGEVDVKDGEWYRKESRGGEFHFDPSPPRQAQNAAYQLRDALKGNHPSFRNLKIAHGVALPDVEAVKGALPLEVTRQMLFLAGDMTQIEEKVIACIEAAQARHYLSDSLLQNFFQIVLPTSRMVFQPDAQRTIYREILNHISLEQVRAMASLDENKRVVVQGSAGTGKTRLAILWARLAMKRGEKTLLTCYNDPLAEFLNATSGDRKLPVIQPFLRLIKDLDGISVLDEPIESKDKDTFWNETLPSHVLSNIEKVSPMFDTIVVDEAQDFAPDWISILESLLLPNGKLLCVADIAQDLYQRGYQPQLDDPRWTKGRLAVNCRNTRQIALLLKKIGGAQPATACPTGDPVRFIPFRTEQDALAAVRNLVSTHTEFHKRQLSDLVLICRTANERRKLRELSTEVAPISSWENRGLGHVACETFRRIKGLEADHVVIVSFDGDFSKQELYVSASRARRTLTIIAPPQTGQLLDLA